MKTKVLVSLSAVTVLILSFQNCSKPGGPSANVSAVGDAKFVTPVQYNKYNTSEFSTLSLWDEHNGRFLDLQLNDGSVVAYEEAGQTRGESYCLNDEQLLAAQNIVNGSEVCEPVIDPAQVKQDMCAMLYDYPYVTLVSQANQVKLGERTSSCDAPVDLCGQKAQQLRTWAANVVAHIADGSVTKSCQ